MQSNGNNNSFVDVGMPTTPSTEREEDLDVWEDQFDDPIASSLGSYILQIIIFHRCRTITTLKTYLVQVISYLNNIYYYIGDDLMIAPSMVVNENLVE